jgi:predicted phosphate transport protein (TIGR00153 family)
VRLNLRPTEASFYDLFAQMAAHLVEGAGMLASLLEADSDRPAIAERMREIEHEADDTTHEIVRRVNSTFITPFDREDIYRLAGELDDVMDFMEEAVDLVLLYEIGKLPSEIAAQVDVLQRATELTADAMPRLRTMKDLEEYWIEINRLENQGDRSHRRMVARLFNGSFEAIEVLKLKDIVDALEHATDALEHVANTVEQIAVKES